MNGLALRQAEVMSAILKFREAHSYSPTYHEIGCQCTVRSERHIQHIVNDLVRKGCVRFTFGIGRSIVPTLHGEALYNEFVLIKGDTRNDLRIQECPAYGHPITGNKDG